MLFIAGGPQTLFRGSSAQVSRCDISEAIAVSQPADRVPSATPRREHIRELDGLRGVAALAVFFHHVCFSTLSPAGCGPAILLLYRASEFGQSGVDIFFVLSGFLITSLLIADRASPAFFHDFYWKRALRILPVYLLCIVGVLLLIPGSGRFALLACLFIANFARVFHVQPEGPFWSLAIEEQFYIFWPTLVRRRSIVAVSRWALAIGGTSMLLRVLAACLRHSDYYFTFFRCDGLAAGALLACWQQRRAASASGALIRREKLLMAASVSGGLALIALARLLPQPPVADFHRMLYQSGQTFLFVGIVAYVIAHRRQGSVALLRSRALTFFGLISYAFYMTHLYVLQLYDHLRGPLNPAYPASYWIRLAAVMLLTVAVSLVSRYAVELPAMSLRRFLLHRPAPQAEIEQPLVRNRS